jgi:predicted kinase
VGCQLPEATLRERVAEREREANDASEAGIAVLERQMATIEPLTADERGDAVIVDGAKGGRAIEAAIESVRTRLAPG